MNQSDNPSCMIRLAWRRNQGVSPCRHLLLGVLVLTVSLLLAFVTLAASPSTIAGSSAPSVGGSVDWPQFHFDAARTGFNSYETILSPSMVVAGLAPRWMARMGIVQSSPAVVDGVVYISGDVLNKDAFLYAFDADGIINCSSTHECDPLWTAPTAGFLASSPAVMNGVVFVASNEPRLYAIDASGNTNCSGNPKSCAPLWTAVLGDGAFLGKAPAVTNGVVYVASDKLYAFDAAGNVNCAGLPRTCTPLWTATAAGSGEPPAVANGVVYISSSTGYDGSLYAFDAAGNLNCAGTPKTCAPLWTAPAPPRPTGYSNAFSGPAVANGLVYVGAADGKLYAFDAAGNLNCGGTPRTCAPLWTAPAGDHITVPAVASGFVYVAANDQNNVGKVFVFDAAGITNCPGTPKTCAPLWTGTLATNDFFLSDDPAVAGGVVYVGSYNARLYAFDAAGNINCGGTPRTCTPLWSGVQYQEVAGSPAVVNGMVYVPEGLLYALGPPVSPTPTPTATPTPTVTPTPVSPPPVSLLPQPIRLVDTRLSGGAITGGTSRCFQVSGQAGTPPDALGVIMNVTGTGYTAPGWLTIYPHGQPVPATSTVNFEPNSYAMANNTIARIGSGGQVCVNVGITSDAPGSAYVILDVTGYLTSTSNTQIALLSQPQRLADTRMSGGPLPTGTSRCFSIAGQAGVPPDAAGVLVNVTGTGYTAPGWLTLYPSGQALPATSTLNVDPRSYAIANGAIARIGSGGQVCVALGTVNNSPANSNVILDVAGYLASSSAAQLPLLTQPQRLVDTRVSGGPIPTGSSRCFSVAGQGAIPPNAVGVIVNVTGVGYTRPGWLTLYPGNQPLPSTSTVNFDTVEYAIANGAIMKLGNNGQACVAVGTVNSTPGGSEAILDATGYLT